MLASLLNKKTGPRPKDISGMRFERLVALKYVELGKWLCECDCGNTTVAVGSDLRRGRIRSCGCLQLEVARTGDCRRTHGGAGSPEYNSWHSMIRRCTDPTTLGYHRYGGRGISVCERWASSFTHFLEDMGFRPTGTTLDRKDVNGNYEPSNCRWATHQEQAENTSRVILVTANGKTQSLGAWARDLGVSDKAIRYRLKIGMSHHNAINKPFRKHKAH